MNLEKYVDTYLEETHKIADLIDKNEIIKGILILKEVQKNRSRLFILGVGGGEEVEVDAEAFEGVEERVVGLGEDLLRRLALGLGGDRDRGAVGVGAGDHQHPAALHPVVAREDVRGQVRTHHLSGVEGRVGVGPGDTNEYGLGHRAGS